LKGRVFRSESTAVFVLDPSRSAKVVENFFSDKSSGIISCDRYRAYFCFVTLADGRFLIAYCWAHVRRDFLALAKDRSPYEAWAMDWVSEIGNLYHINNLRVAQEKDSTEFDEYQSKIEQAVTIFKEKVDKQLAETDLAIPCKKVLESLIRHWHGLITFLKNSQVPMDNNTAERELRRSVVGRKNYYGSGSIKNAQLSAAMFTIVHTLLIWNINPQIWLQRFFDHMGKHWDQDFDSMLPWNLSSEEKEKFLLKSGCGPPS
jgi:transposase